MKFASLFFAFIVSSSSVYAAEKNQKSLDKKPTIQTDSVSPAINCSNTLTARTLAYVCDRIQSADLTIACFQAGRDAYLNECALGACDRFQTGEGTVQCVDAIAGRDYTLEEVLTCDRITSEQQTVGCFYAAGRPVGGVGAPNSDVVRRYATSALSNLHRNDVMSAERDLESLLRYLDRP